MEDSKTVSSITLSKLSIPSKLMEPIKKYLNEQSLLHPCNSCLQRQSNSTTTHCAIYLTCTTNATTQSWFLLPYLMIRPFRNVQNYCKNQAHMHISLNLIWHFIHTWLQHCSTFATPIKQHPGTAAALQMTNTEYIIQMLHSIVLQ